jgi:hypothetical protein
MAAAITGGVAGGPPTVATPERLARGVVSVGDTRVWHTPYDPFPDGQRFVVRDARRGAAPLRLVAPWTAALGSPAP